MVLQFKMTATACCRFSAFPPHCSAWPRNKADQPRCSAGHPTKVQWSAGFGAGERMHLRPLGDRGCCMESPCPRKSNLKIRWFFRKNPGKPNASLILTIPTNQNPATPGVHSIACCRCSSPITGNQLTLCTPKFGVPNLNPLIFHRSINFHGNFHGEIHFSLASSISSNIPTAQLHFAPLTAASEAVKATLDADGRSSRHHLQRWAFWQPGSENAQDFMDQRSC